MSESPTQPADLPATAAPITYAALRDEGLRCLEKLAPPEWTDFNAHDPGITILEQLCYALTDLAYRIDTLPPRHLFASDADGALPALLSAADVLSSSPVTLEDVRKVVLDVPGIRNAWIEGDSDSLLAYDPSDRTLYFQSDDASLMASRHPIVLQGLFQIRVERAGDASPQVANEVRRRLESRRPLGTDFLLPQVLGRQPITVAAEIEIGPVDDPERVLAQVQDALDHAISPRVRRSSLATALQNGLPIDELLEGPMLEHGLIDSADLRAARKKTALHGSDLLTAIMQVPGVRGVRNLEMDQQSSTPWRWLLNVDPRQAPDFEADRSSLRVVRATVARTLDSERIHRLTLDLTRQDALLQRPAAPDVLRIGRDRNVHNYSSIMHQFPAVYGVGPIGLPESATTKRRAQARQLQAYLLLFDQLLADAFAQLGGARHLFSCDQKLSAGSLTWVPPLRDKPFFEHGDDCYFTQPLDERDESELQLKELRKSPDTTPPRPRLERRNRFLNHLLARFGEDFADYSLLGISTGDLVSAKCSFLRDYADIGAGRGRGFNRDRKPADGSDLGALAGLEKRIAGKLGLPAGHRRKLADLKPDDPGGFHLIEHLLLRPVAADRQQWPGEIELGPARAILADASRQDPYSARVSFVFADWLHRQTLPDDSLDSVKATAQVEARARAWRDLAVKIVRDETPAHLATEVHWFNGAQMQDFENAFSKWLSNDRESLAGRDARDRLIALLGMGLPYPLRDLKVTPMAHAIQRGESAKIEIGEAQADVTYQLCNEDGDPLDPGGTKHIARALPHSGLVKRELETPVITQPGEVIYTILATREDTRLTATDKKLDVSAYLASPVRITVAP